ncbi:hypothetical protein [Tsukamurella paurometabola]|uniref:Uncharacterized protein n=1 Tax=Tsukamurella paurometabola TaxID=2061 RepID=A0ABS5NFT8_TSUPA|nr:hypothetical protein [Tsukamurella paurometabola]MBS4102472.1 hypothetical protein [Tsukamurella paurometabola]
MQTFALFTITAAAFTFALYVRRFTWKNDWEKAITLSVLLQFVALILTSPYTTKYLGTPIGDVTGIYGLDAVIGHDLYLVAASSVLYHILYSLHDDEGLQRRFRVYVELPATVALPLLLFTYARSETAERPIEDMFGAQDDTLQPYWIVLTVVVGYLLTFSAWHFAVAWRDETYRWECTGYILASLAGAAACLLRFMGNRWDVPAVSVWVAIAVCGVLFAATSGWQWKRNFSRPEPAQV